MILTVMRTSWLSLRRDPVALVLTFVLPLLFFSIFALVFSAMDEVGANPVRALVVQEDSSELAGALRAALNDSPHLQVAPEVVADRPAAVDRIRARSAQVAIVIPAGFAEDLESAQPGGVPIELLADTSNPIAAEVVAGVVRATVLDVGFRMMTEGEGGAAGGSPLPIAVRDVLGGEGKKPSIAFFAAGVGVMFLLFSLAGRSGLLIEERDSGVVTRMLASRLRLHELLLGRWLFLGALGIAQVTVMFVWGALAFGLDLWTGPHLLGFAVMTVVTAAAASSFSLLLASTCRTRAQLTGVASVLILVMSALGGSMFPRFLMPPGLQKAGLATFNAWALDGYQKVFWYEAGLPDLVPQLAVLGAMTVVFLAGSLATARRWDRA